MNVKNALIQPSAQTKDNGLDTQQKRQK